MKVLFSPLLSASLSLGVAVAESPSIILQNASVLFFTIDVHLSSPSSHAFNFSGDYLYLLQSNWSKTGRLEKENLQHICLLTAYKSMSVLKAMIAKEKSNMKERRKRVSAVFAFCRTLASSSTHTRHTCIETRRDETKRNERRRDVASQYFVHTNISTIEDCNTSLSTHIYLL
jgi:hypothetical protein